MQEFSLERITENIHYAKTKGYFQEVLSSYNNENYRSSVVMLWSVAICDIVYKLQYLIDLYDDVQAKQILQEVTNIQDKDHKSSAWELKLLDEVHSKTDLINSSEYEELTYLQKKRHLSAHPVLNLDRELHSPNKETVRALLRNTLEGLLVKPPIYSKKIIDELLADISESSPALYSREKVKKYIESRYLNRITLTAEMSIFKSLWKLVFKLDNEECKRNRTINLHALEVLSNRNVALIPDEIYGDKDYYSNIAPSGIPVSYLVCYLANNPEIYDAISDDAKMKVQHCISTDKVGKIMGWFIKADLYTHGEDIKKSILSDDRPTFTRAQFDALLAISDTEEWQSMFCDIATTHYCSSRSFDQADNRF